jgi:hypothetical protein
MSQSAEKIFGFSPETFIGTNYFNCLPIKTRAKAKSLFEHFSVNGQPYREVIDLETSTNGKIISYEIFFTPSFNDIGKLSGYRILGWMIKNRS